MTDPTGIVPVTGPDGVVWRTVVKLRPSNVVSVAVEKIGDNLLDAPLGFDLYFDPNSRELREGHGYDWHIEPVSVWRDRLGDQFDQAIKLWQQEARRLLTMIAG